MAVSVMLHVFLLLIIAEAQGCSRPLGMTNGDIRDWQISASSSSSSSSPTHSNRSSHHHHRHEHDADGCHVKHARLHQPRANAWCAKHPAKSNSDWILVDLGVQTQVTGVMCQGRGDEPEWVTSFSLAFSADAYKWKFATDIYGKRKVFVGNSDSHSVKVIYLDESVTARFVRLHVLTWHNHPSLRLEIIGCQDCNEIISLPPASRVSASSYPSWARRNSCQPDDAHLLSHRAWCARHNNAHQWLQFDLGPPVSITGVATRGRGDSGRRQWVSSYTLSFSNDSILWYHYKEGPNHLDPKVFGANMDKWTERRHYLNEPFAARFIRIHPVTWVHAIAMRAAILGCPHSGECGQGFLRVNLLANCVENLAYSKETWSNDRRHGWKEWRQGHSSLAVDGITSRALPHCAILDNYYVDHPLWMVDLGQKRDVQGLLLLTWQGEGQDKSTSYRDYILNLDRLTVYVSQRPRLDALQLHQHESDKNISDTHRCGSVTRSNNALFRPDLHLECEATIRGRYVYIKASGVANRWNRLFSAVLCEVMIY